MTKATASVRAAAFARAALVAVIVLVLDQVTKHTIAAGIVHRLDRDTSGPVSYTHLTLPTILLV